MFFVDSPFQLNLLQKSPRMPKWKKMQISTQNPKQWQYTQNRNHCKKDPTCKKMHRILRPDYDTQFLFCHVQFIFRSSKRGQTFMSGCNFGNCITTATSQFYAQSPPCHLFRKGQYIRVSLTFPPYVAPLAENVCVLDPKSWRGIFWLRGPTRTRTVPTRRWWNLRGHRQNLLHEGICSSWTQCGSFYLEHDQSSQCGFPRLANQLSAPTSLYSTTQQHHRKPRSRANHRTIQRHQR